MIEHLEAWKPTTSEVDEILAELRPLIGRLARRSWEAITAEAARQELAGAGH